MTRAGDGNASERLLAWAKLGALPEAAFAGAADDARAVFGALARDPSDGEALAGVRALAALHEAVAPRGAARLAEAVAAAREAARPEERTSAALFDLAAELALVGSPLAGERPLAPRALADALLARAPQAPAEGRRPPAPEPSAQGAPTSDAAGPA
ncbi:MAG: hypothetical protein D6731_12860, partial [Planctomycetota bacterium]